MELIRMCAVSNCSQRLSRPILWIVTVCTIYWTHITAVCVLISKPRKYKNIFMTREAFNLRKKRIVCGKNTVHQDHLLIIFPIYRLAMH